MQLYEADEAALTHNVGQYLWEGIRQGDGVLVIAMPEHQELFRGHLVGLGADLAVLLKNHQLVFADAELTLSEIMAGGQPDWQNFERVIRGAMRRVRPAIGKQGLRAYGEMVGMLWRVRQFAAAIRLEQLWNKLLEQSAFSLYCAYAIDVFGKEFAVAHLEGVLCTHTHLVPAQSDGSLEAALNRAMDEILGSKADELRILLKSKSAS